MPHSHCSSLTPSLPLSAGENDWSRACTNRAQSSHWWRRDPNHDPHRLWGERQGAILSLFFIFVIPSLLFLRLNAFNNNHFWVPLPDILSFLSQVNFAHEALRLVLAKSSSEFHSLQQCQVNWLLFQSTQVQKNMSAKQVWLQVWTIISLRFHLKNIKSKFRIQMNCD